MSCDQNESLRLFILVHFSLFGGSIYWDFITMETLATAVTTPIALRHHAGRCTSCLPKAALPALGCCAIDLFSWGMVHFPLRRDWISRLRLALTLFGLPCTVCTSGGRYVTDKNGYEVS